MKISKTLQITLIALITAILLIIFLPGVLIPKMLSSQIKSRTGFSVDFGNVNISILSGFIEFKDVRLENPKTFAVKEFVHVNHFMLKMDPLSLFHDRIFIKNLILDINHVAFVQDADKKSNMELFSERLESSFDKKEGSSQKSSQDTDTKGSKKQKAFLIKNLSFSLQSLKAILDNGSKDPIKVESSSPIQKEYTDVSEANIKQVITPLSAEITRKGLSLLAQIVIKKTTAIIPDPQDLGQGIKSIGQGAVDGIKSLFGK